MTYLDKNSYESATSKGFCVVILGAPWCKDCIALKPILERVIPAYADRINFFGVNFDEAEELKESLNVRKIPTIIFYKEGKEVGTRLIEPNSQDTLEKAFNELLKV